jgi:3-hydroxybutyryl-CoA dehydrogenase
MQSEKEIRHIAVLGAGIMGRGIAQSFLIGGYPVILHDIQETIIASARAHIRQNMTLFHRAGLLREEEIAPAMARLSHTLHLEEAVATADFVIETVSEDLSLKQQIFQQTEAFCRANTIIASNTSSLTIREIGRLVTNRQRTVITHWFNPPHIVPVVEVVKGKETAEKTIDATCALLVRIRKLPIRISWEIPGFLVNRILIAMIREVFDLYEKGVASAEDIDRAVKGSFGFRLPSIGPLLTVDLGGLDTWHRVCLNLLPEIQSSTAPPAILEKLIKEGHLGIKTGKGFYDYTVDFSGVGVDEIIRKRDQELLKRLKDLYWDQTIPS